MTVRLTDKHVLALKAKGAGRLDVFDAQEPGLMIRVSDSGRKTWFVRYRLPDGRHPRMKLGTYPATGIADARTRARDIRQGVEAGKDPAALKRAEVAKTKAQTIRNFGDLTDAYFVACTGGFYQPKGKPKSAKTIASEQRLYDRHIKATFGNRAIGEIGRVEIKTLTRSMLARGIKTQTNHAFALVRQVLSYAVEEELISVNMAKAMASPAPKRARERVLSDTELRALWNALLNPAALRDARGGRIYVGASTSIALRLVALLLQRRIEVAGMKVSELDLAHATWTIPGERAKNGQPHLVPLPPAALELIEEALALDTRDGSSEYVFPARYNPERPMSEDSLTRAMGAAMKALKLTVAGPHDLRRTGATILSSERGGVSPFIVSQILNHITDAGGGSSTTRRHYNVNRYFNEKKHALDVWEGLLLGIVAAHSMPVEAARPQPLHLELS